MAYTIKYKSKQVELPEFGKLPVGVLRKARHVADSDQTWFILEELLDEKDMELIDSLPTEDFIKHMKAWTEGVSLGE